jgi:hypothetical protein
MHVGYGRGPRGASGRTHGEGGDGGPRVAEVDGAEVPRPDPAVPNPPVPRLLASRCTDEPLLLAQLVAPGAMSCEDISLQTALPHIDMCAAAAACAVGRRTLYRIYPSETRRKQCGLPEDGFRARGLSRQRRASSA